MDVENSSRLPARKPDWLKAKPFQGDNANRVRSLMQEFALNTVCEEAGCPNCGECYNQLSAAFLIMGSICTRGCRFCQVNKGNPQLLDPDEPHRLAEAVARLRLRHVVVTSVTRDDLPDGGAHHFARVIKEIRETCRDNPPTIEVLIPDFQGDVHALADVAAAGPDILNHNIETIPRLYPVIRPQADYQRSLDLLAKAPGLNPAMIIKSGLMVGLGETPEEILQVMQDLRQHRCDMLTIGQYLAPSRNHYPVQAYIHPDLFTWYHERADELGFRATAAGPLVRSSYMADRLFQRIEHQ
jgi:lipoyl synthase